MSDPAPQPSQPTQPATPPPPVPSGLDRPAGEIPTIRARPQDILKAAGSSPAQGTKVPRSSALTPKVRVVQSRVTVGQVLGFAALFLLIIGVGAGAFWWISQPVEDPRAKTDPSKGPDTAAPKEDENAKLIQQGRDRLTAAARLQADRIEQWAALRDAAASAVSLLTTAIEQNRGAADAHYHRAGAKLLVYDCAGAIADADRAVELEPGNGLYLLRRALARLEQHALARRQARLRGEAPPPIDELRPLAEDFRKAGASGTEGVLAPYCDAAAAMAEGRLATASSLIDRAVLKGGREDWNLLWAIVYELQGKDAGAVIDLTRYLQKRPNSPELYLARALACGGSGDWEQAEKDATLYMKFAKDPTPTQAFRAELRALRRDWRAAFDDCRAVLTKDKRNARANLVFARGSVAMKDWDTAAAVIRALLDADPGRVEALLLAAEVDAWHARWDEAERSITRAMDADPRSPAPLVARSDLRAAKGDAEAAMKDAEAAVKLGPENARALSARGDRWRERRENDKALDDYRAAAMVNQKESRAHVGLALALHAQGDRDSAVRAAMGATQNDPRNIDLMVAAALTMRGSAMSELAFRMVEDALRIDPKNPDAYIARGLLWLDKENPKRMLEDLRKAEEVCPRDKLRVAAIIEDNKPKPKPPPEPPKPPDEPKPDDPKPDDPKPDDPKPDPKPDPPKPPEPEPKPEPPKEKPFNLWTGVKPGTWYRVRQGGAGQADSYVDVGLKEVGDSHFVQHVHEQGKDETVAKVDLSAQKILRDETLTIDGKEYKCRVVDSGDAKVWQCKEGLLTGRVLKAEGVQKIAAVKISFEKYKLKDREVDCAVVENEIVLPQGTITQKSWIVREIAFEFVKMEVGIPGALLTIELVEMGDDWSKRPAFPK